ncbi:MAG: retron St85 family effector protein, partial [Halothiobacillus sp.]
MQPFVQNQEPHDPRDELLSAIDFEKCKVNLSDSPIVLLCGGQANNEKNTPDDPDLPVQSLRHAIVNHALYHTVPYEIFRPEEIKDWNTDGVFKNLMSFEEELANICSLVVVILESAGSIAELGAFSQLEDLSSKLIAIHSGIFNDESSFINLGILRYLIGNKRSSVKNYPWDMVSPG